MKIISKKLIVPVILSGGAGTRLWPMSREDYPKQFYKLLDNHHSVLQKTVMRISDPNVFAPPIVVGLEKHRFLIANQLKDIGFSSPEVIVEPAGRNTAPAITVAASHIAEKYNHTLMLILPTDQHITDTDAFLNGVQRAAQAAAMGYLVTFGIKPTYPETGYGYIRCGATCGDMDAFTVDAFAEKPDMDTAKQYVSHGKYLWNSGMFLFSVPHLLEEVKRYNPILAKMSRESLDKKHADKHFIHPNWDAYKKMPNISIDYALMEQTKQAAVVPLECGWSDIGAWDAFWRLSSKDDNGNALAGECYSLNSRDCYLRSENGRTIAAYGVENLVVIATKDAVLVTPKDQAQALKILVEHLRQNKPDLVAQNYQTYRPWGMYESLNNGKRYQVKHISVNPGEQLSLQLHHHRAEHWIVVSGTAEVTCDEKVQLLTENQAFYIPLGSVHRIANPGKIPLDIIEVQSGAYLGEDDIVRLEDRYGRSQAVAVNEPKTKSIQTVARKRTHKRHASRSS